ncbi:MAG: hypothetical protein P8014_17065 [Acidihalobacter sp.]|uniref:hypothetical protein n=1 Tax=Acidihalobacter sp. TaxID=1872108 RepID=UPI00307DB9AF
MDSSPIAAWTHASAYFTFANHESTIVAILILSIVLTVAVLADIIRHEKHAEAKVLTGHAAMADENES